MFIKITPVKFKKAPITQFPHCDPRILHAPTECSFCDEHSDWQFLRFQWGIAFTGWEPTEKELPDPATYARGYANANAWGGNKATIGAAVQYNLAGGNVAGRPASK